jgi:hypothetical protein
MPVVSDATFALATVFLLYGSEMRSEKKPFFLRIQVIRLKPKSVTGRADEVAPPRLLLSI